MSYSPIDASLYVTFSTIIHPDSCLARIAENRIPDPVKEDAIIRQHILSFATPFSPLEHYSAIMYEFSKSLYVSFLNASVPATHMTTQVLARDIQSEPMTGIHMTQLQFLQKMEERLDYIKHTHAADPLLALPSIKLKTDLVRNIFADSRQNITHDEFTELMDKAETAEEYKSRFTFANSLLIPR